MNHISKEQYDRIGADYKGVYQDYQGAFPQRKGRRTAFLPGHGTTLFTEGIHFLVDGDYKHLPELNKSNAEVGAAYRFCDSYQIVQSVYRITEEYAAENELMYLDRVITNSGDFALPGSEIYSATAE